MKIQEICLYGFKSFYEETKFFLNPGITAFVGPNGSGKSNIFDALRWVFGEQSMKALRCEKNEDLIHTSPEVKDNVNFTEVSIIIDNEDYFPQFGSEFEIKRKFYRTGESEFFLNRVKCRLQDIQALFLNLGTLTYSFLELAEIEKIIGGDTKEMFDDVSGILKYQERREQTKRRLEATEQDLLRLEDVIGEMERSIRILKRQARQAQMYHDLKEEYKVLSLALMKKEYDETSDHVYSIQENVDKKDTEKQSLAQAINKLEEERGNLKEKMAHAESEKKEIIAQLGMLNQGIDNLQKEIAEKEDAAKDLTIVCERLLVSIKEKEEILLTNKNRLVEYERLKAKVSTEINKLNKDIAKEQSFYDEKLKVYLSNKKNVKEMEEIIHKLSAEIQTYNSEIGKLEYTEKNIKTLITRILEEYEIVQKNLEDVKAAKKILQKEQNSVIELQEKATVHLNEISEELKKEENRLIELDDDLKRRQEEINDCKIVIDTLAHRLGRHEGIKEIEKKFGNRLAGLLRDNLEVVSGYETVVDVCLGDVLDFYLLSDFKAKDFSGLPEGKIGFIHIGMGFTKEECPDLLKEFKNLTSVIEFNSDKPLAHFLERYFLIDDFDKALRFSADFPEYGFVTSDGILFKNGLVIVQRGAIGYFKIMRSLEEYKKRVEVLQNEIVFISDERKRLFSEIKKIKEDIEMGKEQLFTINIKRSEVSLRLNEAEKNFEEIMQEAADLKKDLDSQEKEIESVSKQIEGILEKKVSIEIRINDFEKEKNALLESGIQLEKELDVNNSTLNDLNLKMGILRERLNSIENATQQLNVEIGAIGSEIKTLKTDTQTQDLIELNESISSLKKELRLKKEAKEDLESKIPDKLIDDLTKNQGSIYDHLTYMQKQNEDVQNDIMQLKYELFQLNQKRDELTKKSQEEFNVDLTTYIAEEILNTETKRNEIKERLERLGIINPLSVQAYEEEKKRLDEFLTQRNDIIAAKQSLLKSIEELDQRARDRFIEVFGQVKEKFNMVFSNFFEGGEADLILTDALNPLTSGIEIAVRLRGKRVKFINQLSGGERTLLAVSLLLAFYLVKPAPFCILDEIDAPLDDANVVRFNRFLRDLSQRTQVVIITHNRATMEYADYLYGLTLEKPGQSKVVSVKLADLERLEPVSIE